LLAQTQIMNFLYFTLKQRQHCTSLNHCFLWISFVS